MRIERHKVEERAAKTPRMRAIDGPVHSKAPKSEASQIDWDEDEYKDLRKDARTAAADGKIPLILSSDDETKAGLMADVCQKFSKTSKKISKLPVVNGLTTWVESRQLKRFLTSLPDGANVVVDRPLHHTKTSAPEHIFLEAPEQPTAPPVSGASRLPGLDKVWSQGFKGQGQRLVIIDSGIYPHPDLKGKIDVWMDFNEGKPKPIDPFGHATHVAGLAVGDGSKSDGKIQGVAPEAHLVALRIGSVGDAIKALQWCVDNKEKYDLSVINMSLGDKATKPWAQDPWALAVQKAVDAGMMVVTAAGNNGPISTPGTFPGALTVGAVDNKGTDDPSDDTLASFSAKGQLVDGVQKPDILAPGVGLYSTLSPGSAIDQPNLPHLKKDYIALSGTSQSAPLVAALGLLLHQARPDLTPAQLDQAVMQSGHHYPQIADLDQGAGLVQADKALEIAQAMPKAGPATANA